MYIYIYIYIYIYMYIFIFFLGIVSWGRGCGRSHFPGIFTKLTNYIGWLKDHLDDECVCPPPHQQ